MLLFHFDFSLASHFGRLSKGFDLFLFCFGVDVGKVESIPQVAHKCVLTLVVKV